MIKNQIVYFYSFIKRAIMLIRIYLMSTYLNIIIWLKAKMEYQKLLGQLKKDIFNFIFSNHLKKRGLLKKDYQIDFMCEPK